MSNYLAYAIVSRPLNASWRTGHSCVTDMSASQLVSMCLEYVCAHKIGSVALMPIPVLWNEVDQG